MAFLSAFGVLAALTGVFAALYPDYMKTQSWSYLAWLSGTCLLFALVRSIPRRSVFTALTVPPCEVRVRVGDLFEQDGNLAVGMSDTFDVKVPDVISAGSVQGQLLGRIYEGKEVVLAGEIESQLADEQITSSEVRSAKRIGNLDRYQVGTVAVLSRSGRKFFCVAYSRLSNENRAESSVDELWASLSQLWRKVRDRGELSPINVPVMGAGLARLGGRLTHEDLIKLIALSFVTASRDEIVARKLTIVVSRSDASSIDFARLRASMVS